MNGNRGLYLLQAVRGPVLLITIGLLFAIDQAGILSFGRTWPLILIVLGVMKLLERSVAPPVVFPPFGAPPPQGRPPFAPPPPPPPPPFGGRRL